MNYSCIIFSFLAISAPSREKKEEIVGPPPQPYFPYITGLTPERQLAETTVACRRKTEVTQFVRMVRNKNKVSGGCFAKFEVGAAFWRKKNGILGVL